MGRNEAEEDVSAKIGQYSWHRPKWRVVSRKAANHARVDIPHTDAKFRGLVVRIGWALF